MLFERKINPKKIAHWSCETISDYKELSNLLEVLLSSNEVAFLFLDEISFVDEWQRAILAAANMGRLRKVAVLITGSNAHDLKKSSERLPGRRGTGQDLSMYPLSISELHSLKSFSHFKSSEITDLYFKIGGFCG